MRSWLRKVRKNMTTPTFEIRNLWPLKYTQDSISCHFSGSHMNVNLGTAVQKIKSGEWSADDFPPMTAVAYGGDLWCLNNRRLWVFKKAGVRTAGVTIISDPRDWRVKEFMERATDKLIQRWSSENFEPTVRGRVYEMDDDIYQPPSSGGATVRSFHTASPASTWSTEECIGYGVIIFFVLNALVLYWRS